MRTTSQSGAVSRKLLIGISIPLILICLAFGWSSFTRYKYQRARAAWKSTALERLAGLSFTNAEIAGELEKLKASRGAGDRQQWTGEHVLLMTNDEYLVYASRHGFNNGLVDHLFLARGSDGRWYYSTYHFCNSMVAAMSDDPPGSITEFAKTYSAREFDGKSDVCLQHTWPEKE
jgi:hypothetical protein